MTQGVLCCLFPSSVDDSGQLLKSGPLCVHIQMRTLQRPPCKSSCWVVVGLVLSLLDQRLCWKICACGGIFFVIPVVVSD